MPSRPRSSCQPCRRLKRVCVREEGQACEACVRADRECDLEGVSKRARPESAIVALPRRTGFVSEEMHSLIDVALRSSVAWTMVRPEAVRAALQLVSSADLCSRDGVAARALLHATAAAGGLATCDANFAMTASANICQARALALSTVGRGHELLPFVHMALAEACNWCRDFPGMLERWCMAGMATLWATTPADLKTGASVHHVLPRVARAVVTGPYASPRPNRLDPLEPGGGLLELMQCLSISCPERVPDMDVEGGNFKHPPRKSSNVAWDGLSDGSPCLRVFKASMAAHEVVFDSLLVNLLPVPPQEQLRAIIDAASVELAGWTGIYSHVLRAIAHYQLGELGPAVEQSEVCFRAALADPRCLGAGIMQGSVNVLINIWRADLSGAGDGLPLDRVIAALSDIVETLHGVAKTVSPDAQYVPAVFVEQMSMSLSAESPTDLPAWEGLEVLEGLAFGDGEGLEDALDSLDAFGDGADALDVLDVIGGMVADPAPT